MQEAKQKSFNFYLARALVRIAREWVKVDASVLTELKRLASKLKAPEAGIDTQEQSFPAAVRRSTSFAASGKAAGAALAGGKGARRTKSRTSVRSPRRRRRWASGLLTYLPVRPENLWELEFDKHLFVRG